jgi:hypothetical protein
MKTDHQKANKQYGTPFQHSPNLSKDSLADKQKSLGKLIAKAFHIIVQRI